MDLAHAALGDAEQLADLGERETLVVVEREHETLAVGHAVDRVGEEVLHLVDLERLDRVVLAVGDGVADRGRPLTVGRAGREQVVERDETGERDLRERLGELALGPLELGRDLAVLRAAPELVLELGDRPLDGTRLRPHRARHPVDRAELVDDRALDPRDRVGLELEAAAGIELVDGVDEPEDPVAHEVGLLDVLRQTGGDAAGDELHQRRVVEDQPLARVGGAVRLVVGPEVVERFVGIVRHGDGSLRRRPGAGRG